MAGSLKHKTRRQPTAGIWRSQTNTPLSTRQCVSGCSQGDRVDASMPTERHAVGEALLECTKVFVMTSTASAFTPVGLGSGTNSIQMGSTVLHFGPAHPAAHGVLRCMLCMRGEYILGCTLTLGLLHRATELLMEIRHPVTSWVPL